jgi:hypothetical protein
VCTSTRLLVHASLVCEGSSLRSRLEAVRRGGDNIRGFLT